MMPFGPCPTSSGLSLHSLVGKRGKLTSQKRPIESGKGNLYKWLTCRVFIDDGLLFSPFNSSTGFSVIVVIL